MGFKITPRTFKLRFEDEEYAGAVVRARSFSTGEMLELQELQERATVGEASAIKAVLVRMVDAIVDWNLEDADGDPMPIDLKTLESLDFYFVAQIVNALFTAIAGVDTPLQRKSTSGVTSLESSIPMETL